MALAESYDIKRTDQLLTFISGIDRTFEISEQLFPLNTTPEKDLYESLRICIDRYTLLVNELVYVRTDGSITEKTCFEFCWVNWNASIEMSCNIMYTG